MKISLPCYYLLYLTLTRLLQHQTLGLDLPCRTTCGYLQVKYPFGSEPGCGSARFHPYVSCSSSGNQLLFTTHTGSYPITSISYTTSTITITPPYMSTCTSMQPSPNLGLDWASPFQLGPSTFLLLSCTPPTTTSSTIKDSSGSPLCDASSSHICDSIYTCPSVVGLGLPLFSATNTCCVYSPANFDSKGELDLDALKCKGYSSIVSFEDYPTDPNRWEYGVVLTYKNGAFDDYDAVNRCNTCEGSGGVCGYAPPSNSFVCLCTKDINTTTSCTSYVQYQDTIWSLASRSYWIGWLQWVAGLVFFRKLSY